MNYLCDTNVISGVMRRHPSPTIRQWLDEQPTILVSVITVDEVVFGLAAKDAQRQLEWFELFLQNRCQVLSITMAIAHQAGLQRGFVRRQGITRTQADYLIAATAQQHSLVLATQNTRDFIDYGIPLFNPFEPEL